MDVIRFDTDGWRARYDGSFTEANVARITAAFVESLPSEARDGSIFVGYGTRRDAQRYACIVTRAIASCGMHAVLAADYCPSAALSWNIAHDQQCVAGLMITAGHLSSLWNGIKVYDSDGGPISRTLAHAVEMRASTYDDETIDLICETSLEADNTETCDFAQLYEEEVKRRIDSHKTESSDCVLRGLSVVHDALYGSSRKYAPNLLLDLGAHVLELHGASPQDFGTIPSLPVEPWTQECSRTVIANRANLGLVNGADACRVGAIDEQGTFVPAHQVAALDLALLCEQWGLTGRVVVTNPTSSLVARQARRLGCPVTIVPVGYENVISESRKADVLISVQESGAIMFPGLSLERDGILAGVLLSCLLARSDRRLSELVDILKDQNGNMSYGRRDIEVDQGSIQILKNMLPGLNPPKIAGILAKEIEHTDGIRVNLEDESWVMVRLSSSEPLIRIYAEAHDVFERDALIDEVARLLSSL